MNTARMRAFPLAAACLLAITSRAAGQQPDYERESLAGLDGLRVIVEMRPMEGQTGGLTTGALQTYLEMRLRQARVGVLSLDESLALERSPMLHLFVLVVPLTSGWWAYSLDLEVLQITCIKDGMEVGACLMSSTWDDAGLYTARENISDAVRGELAVLMDELLNDYLAVNP